MTVTRASADDITIRRGTPDDLPFLRRVHRAAMRPHIEATWGPWDEDDQRRRFDESTNPTAHDIIEYRGAAVGCQLLRSHTGFIELVRLWLLPEAQGLGIGTSLLTRLCDHAASLELPVRLSVLHVNRAQHLYRRVGFVPIGETDTHILMQHVTDSPTHLR